MEDFEKDVEDLLSDYNSTSTSTSSSFERDKLIRSGSAPPTVQGSRAGLSSLFGRRGIIGLDVFGDGGGGGISEEEMISRPAYLSYYSSNKNLNPRLPPPAVSKDDWIFAQRLKAGAIGDGRRSEEPSNGDGLGARRKSLQTDLGQSAATSRPIPGQISRSPLDNAVGTMGASASQLVKLQNGLVSRDEVYSRATSPRLVRVQSVSSFISRSLTPERESSPARSKTPDPQMFRRSPSPRIPPVRLKTCDAARKAVDFNYVGSVSSHAADCSDVSASLGGLSLSKELVDEENNSEGPFHQNLINQPERLLKTSSNLSQYMQQNNINNSAADSSKNATHCLLQKNGARENLDTSILTPNGQMELPKQPPSSNLYPMVTSAGLVNNYQNVHRTNTELTKSKPNVYSANQGLPDMTNNQLDAGLTYMGTVEQQYLYSVPNQGGYGFQPPNLCPLYAPYMQCTADSALQAPGSLDQFLPSNYFGPSQMDFSGYSGALLAQQNLNYGMPFISNPGGSDYGYYGSLPIDLSMHYPIGPIPSPDLSPLNIGSPVEQNEWLPHFPPTIGKTTGRSIGFRNTENGLIKEHCASLLLDEFKSNKTRSFELLEIAGHAVEFSRDQYGSRFIQQKLETASVEEKHKIYLEILPYAHDLMNDVFGNYVIQKFFEYGTQIQRKQLARQLTGHVLPLSFQMYGCRVIQKALEVVDIDQQAQMVTELDGSVMNCVLDQNGNHVIQKCIECVPQENIQFIISTFYGQVVGLSTHPYGCRVIQRVLEHCHDAKTRSIITDEILQAVCTLAQDQYGNYVVQHVVQHGNQEERSAIISKLAGQIVGMSHQKFASNVVEQCLTYGTPEERQLLIDKFLGSTEENEPLEAMMKDQFANYVVQKALKTCSDENRELILSRIRVHLNAMKKYTYGKHLVTRVEKLLAAGEMHSASASKFS